MVKFKLILLVILVNIFFLADLNAGDLSLYVGTGPGLNFPKNYRIAYDNIELGMYSNSIALMKLFEKGTTYAGLGAGIVTQGIADYGFVASAGYHKVWGLFGFRADWSTIAGVSSYLNSEISIGLSLNF